MKALLAFAIFLITALWLVGCDSHRSTRQFMSVPVRVTDAATQQAIVGAIVHSFCMGGTPYETNVYHTDTNGIARVMYYDGSTLVGVKVERPGYETASTALVPTNPVVSLRRVQ